MSLTLSRRVNETVVIAGNIEVTVVEIRAGQVRLSITAPRNISVDRKEIHDAKVLDLKGGLDSVVHP